MIWGDANSNPNVLGSLRGSGKLETARAKDSIAVEASASAIGTRVLCFGKGPIIRFSNRTSGWLLLCVPKDGKYIQIAPASENASSAE